MDSLFYYIPSQSPSIVNVLFLCSCALIASQLCALGRMFIRIHDLNMTQHATAAPAAAGAPQPRPASALLVVPALGAWIHTFDGYSRAHILHMLKQGRPGATAEANTLSCAASLTLLTTSLELPPEPVPPSIPAPSSSSPAPPAAPVPALPPLSLRVSVSSFAPPPSVLHVYWAVHPSFVRTLYRHGAAAASLVMAHVAAAQAPAKVIVALTYTRVNVEPHADTIALPLPSCVVPVLRPDSYVAVIVADCPALTAVPALIVRRKGATASLESVPIQITPTASLRNTAVRATAACVVCMSAAPDVLLHPCAHMCVCSECFSHIHNRACPLCRTVARGHVELVGSPRVAAIVEAET